MIPETANEETDWLMAAERTETGPPAEESMATRTGLRHPSMNPLLIAQ